MLTETKSPAFPKGVPKPALRALAAAGVSKLSDLRGFGEEKLSALHGMGPKAIGILETALKEKGWSLAKR